MNFISSPPDHTSSAQEPAAPARSKKLRSTFKWLVCLCLFAVTFAVHFRDLNKLGLYEDDYWSIGPDLGAQVARLGPTAIRLFQTWPLGRPLNHLLPPVLSTIGSQLGGLPGVYFLACLWLTFNCLLVFRALGFLVSRQAALFGALAYVLFPGDTTHTLLTHAAHVQGSMTFLLLALNLYISNRPVSLELHGRGTGRKVALDVAVSKSSLSFSLFNHSTQLLAYPIAGLSLLSYETAFLPFVMAPFLRFQWTRKFLGRLLLHGLLCAVVVGTVAFIRLHLQEGRAVDLMRSPTEMLWRMVSSLWIGPLTLVQTYRLALDSVFGNLSAVSAGIAGGTAFVFFWLARWLDPESHSGQSANAQIPGPRFVFFTPTGPTPLCLIGVGAVTVCWSYVLTIVNYPPTFVLGRFTSVHTATAWGAALMSAALFQALSTRFVTHRSAVIAAGGLAVFVFANYGCFIEQGYVEAWKIQQRFWRQIAALTPDLNGQTGIIVIGDIPKQNPVIRSNTWEDFQVIPLLLQASDRAAEKPYCAFLQVIEETFRVTNGQLLWKPHPILPDYLKLDESNLVLLRMDGETLTRINSFPLPSVNRELHSKPMGPATAFWKDLTPLGRFMLGNGVPSTSACVPATSR